MNEHDGYRPSSYGDSFADVYDDWYANVSDIDATVATLGSLANGRPLLELGVGTGRIAVPLAATGVSVVGVDASRAMLDILRNKSDAAAIIAIEADMAALEQARGLSDRGPFGVVFAAFNTFFNLPTDSAQADCLEGCHGVLFDDGRLVIEGFVPPEGGLADGGVSVRDVTARTAVLTVSTHDADDQLIRGHHIEMRSDGNTMRPWIIHYRTPEQLDASAEAAGFVLDHRWADWDGTPFDPAVHDVHITVYRKVSSP
ncbi:MAG: class I SAM-dependent methyltransferase [Acidimicrobiales bacterium]